MLPWFKMHFGKNNPENNYTMNGYQLKKVKNEKDVGVIVSEDLKPSTQVLKAVNTANKVLGLMARGVHFRDKRTWIDLYKTYVRPHLEYAVQCWSPWSQKDIKLIEGVQEKAVNMCSGLKSKTYNERLHELKLLSLEERRHVSDMAQVWKILNKKDRICESSFFNRLCDTSNRTTRAASCRDNLSLPKFNLEIRRNFFSCQVVESWNSLPEDS